MRHDYKGDFDNIKELVYADDASRKRSCYPAGCHRPILAYRRGFFRSGALEIAKSSIK